MRHFLKEIPMKRITNEDTRETFDVLRSVKLFDGVDEGLLSSALESGDIEAWEYDGGEAIFSPTIKRKRAVIYLYLSQTE